MTAEEFVEQKYDLPEGGRWSELIRGELITLDQPSDAHGNVIRNLSRALAIWIEEKGIGYACFELGLVVRRAPDTVIFPAVSYFLEGNRWDETDKVVTDSRPALVIEVASTVQRRRNMPERISHYKECGTQIVIVIDPVEQKIAIHSHNDRLEVLSADDIFVARDDWCDSPSGETLLAGFTIPVAEIFQQPEWWEWPDRQE